MADDRGQPIEPHIVAVADAFDAMTSTRSYRKALPQETAFGELRKNSGKQFHPRVVDALILAIEQRGEEHGEGHEEVVHHADSAEVGHRIGRSRRPAQRRRDRLRAARPADDDGRRLVIVGGLGAIAAGIAELVDPGGSSTRARGPRRRRDRGELLVLRPANGLRCRSRTRSSSSSCAPASRRSSS